MGNYVLLLDAKLVCHKLFDRKILVTAYERLYFLLNFDLGVYFLRRAQVGSNTGYAEQIPF